MMSENIEPNAFDDTPLDQLKSVFTVSETAEPEAIDADAALPLAQRLVAAKPMVRKQAYAELSALLEGSAADAAPFKEYGPLLKKVLGLTPLYIIPQRSL